MKFPCLIYQVYTVFTLEKRDQAGWSGHFLICEIFTGQSVAFFGCLAPQVYTVFTLEKRGQAG